MFLKDIQFLPWHNSCKVFRLPTLRGHFQLICYNFDFDADMDSDAHYASLFMWSQQLNPYTVDRLRLQPVGVGPSLTLMMSLIYMSSKWSNKSISTWDGFLPLLPNPFRFKGWVVLFDLFLYQFLGS